MTATQTPAIPSWEWTDLEQLSAAGDLSGVSPVVIGSIDQAESSGQGGGINPEGYGGFFGLGSNSTYPGGSTSPALLESASEQSFEQQAEIAASAFASYLTEAGGNPITAEEIYQTGSASGPTEGSKILASNLGQSAPLAGPTSPTGATATDASLNANPFDLFGIPQTVGSSAASAVWSEVGPFVVKAILVIAGLSIVVLGVYHLASPKIRQAVGDAKEAAGPAAELGAVAA